MCLSIPPRVIDETPTVAPKPAASSPPHFHAKVARWYSRKPTRVAVSSPARGGSGRPCSSTSVMGGESIRAAPRRHAVLEQPELRLLNDQEEKAQGRRMINKDAPPLIPGRF